VISRTSGLQKNLTGAKIEFPSPATTLRIEFFPSKLQPEVPLANLFGKSLLVVSAPIIGSLT
jgi:hypothetical protein